MAVIRSLSFAWFNEEDWPQWCSIDPQLKGDYKHWLVRSEAKFKKVEALGHSIKKIVIFPGEFIAWSRVNGGAIDSNARAAFVAYKAARKHTDH